MVSHQLRSSPAPSASSGPRSQALTRAPHGLISLVNRRLGFYREHDFKADPQRVAKPFMMAADAFAQQLNEAHPDVTSLCDVETLRKSHSVVLVDDR
jgi:hypothetical protein